MVLVFEIYLRRETNYQKHPSMLWSLLPFDGRSVSDDSKHWVFKWSSSICNPFISVSSASLSFIILEFWNEENKNKLNRRIITVDLKLEQKQNFVLISAFVVNEWMASPLQNVIIATLLHFIGCYSAPL